MLCYLKTFLQTGKRRAAENNKQDGGGGDHLSALAPSCLCVLGYEFSLIWAQCWINMTASNTVSALTGCHYNQPIWLDAECFHTILGDEFPLSVCVTWPTPPKAEKNFIKLQIKSINQSYLCKFVLFVDMAHCLQSCLNYNFIGPLHNMYEDV